MDRLYQARDERKKSSLMTIDQSATFDCVSHAILLRKMRVYKMDESVLKWIESYLGSRTQFVTVGRIKLKNGGCE